MDKLSEMPDKELVVLFKNGSQQAFEELYIRYEKKLMLFCKRSLRDESRAEDIAHDVLLQVFETYYTLNPELSFYNYLQTIAKNRIIDEFKKYEVHSRYVHNITTLQKEVTNQTEDTIISNNYVKLLNELIEGLTPRQKEIFKLSRIRGLTYPEIAELLHISPPTVQKHASLALEKIKKQLMEHADLHLKTATAILMFIYYY